MVVHYFRAGGRACDGGPAAPLMDEFAAIAERWLDADEVADADAYDPAWTSSDEPHAVTCPACLADAGCLACRSSRRPPQPLMAE